MKEKRAAYTGSDNLESMQEAVNYNDNLVSFIRKSTKLNKSKNILDFGAGSGTYADILKNEGVIVDCLEPDAKLGDILKTKGYGVIPSIDKLTPNHYDVIFAFNVFEHIKDDNEVIAKLKKALNKNGKLIIYVPAFQVLFSSMDRRVGHYRRYTKPLLRKLALDNGYKISELVYCDPVGFFAALAYRFVGGKNGFVSPASIRFYDKFLFPLSKRLELIFRHVGGKNVLMIATKNEP